MKALIYQYFDKPVSADTSQYWNCGVPSIKAYAKKPKLAYRLVSDPAPFHPHYGTLMPFWQKWYDDWDCLIYIDADVLAMVDSRNILDYINYDEINISHMNSGPLRKDVPPVESQPPWGPAGHANAGVVVIPKAAYKDFAEYLGDFSRHWARDKNNGNWDAPNTFGGGDQQVFNMYAKEINRALPNLSWHFNYHMTRYEHDRRFESSLIHYHGKPANRKIMINDFHNDKRVIK